MVRQHFWKKGIDDVLGRNPSSNWRRDHVDGSVLLVLTIPPVAIYPVWSHTTPAAFSVGFLAFPKHPIDTQLFKMWHIRMHENIRVDNWRLLLFPTPNARSQLISGQGTQRWDIQRQQTWSHLPIPGPSVRYYKHRSEGKTDSTHYSICI